MRESQMLLGQCDDHVDLLTKALGAAFDPVAAELRLVDAGDFIAFIHDEKFANIQDIVNSSVELYFKPGTVSFGWGAEYELDWVSSPVITLDMELRHGPVWLVFKLFLRASRTDVKVEYYSTGGVLGESSQDMLELIEAIKSARLNARE